MMLRVPRLMLSIAALLVGGCAQTIRTIPAELSPKDIAGLDAAYKSGDLAMIWDGNVDVCIRLTAKDAVTRAPVSNATVTLARDRRVSRGVEGRTYSNPPQTTANSAGYAALQATFPAVGDVRAW